MDWVTLNFSFDSQLCLFLLFSLSDNMVEVLEGLPICVVNPERTKKPKLGLTFFFLAVLNRSYMEFEFYFSQCDQLNFSF